MRHSVPVGPDAPGAETAARRRALDLPALYRRAGADWPFGNPAADHCAPFEGYYWRFTDPRRARVVIALCGICRLGGRRWALAALAAHPSKLVRTAILEPAGGEREAFGVWAGDAVAASEQRVRFRLGPEAWLDAEVQPHARWPRRRWGGAGIAHLVPSLPQYWHPWLLGGVASGEATLGGERISLAGASVYMEKNWGRDFPQRWWWGQADAFGDEDICVAFAGGQLRIAGLTLTPTLVAVRFGDRLLSLAPPTARAVAEVGGGRWRIRAASPTHVVEIEGEDRGTSVRLPVPAADRIAAEARSCQALAGRLRVLVRRRGRTLLDGESELAGLESATRDGACG